MDLRNRVLVAGLCEVSPFFDIDLVDIGLVGHRHSDEASP